MNIELFILLSLMSLYYTKKCRNMRIEPNN